jgi:hypothetical protein
MAAQDLSTQFDADWQKAQKRYQDYVNVAYTKDEAAFIAKSKDKAAAKAAIEAKTAAEADQLYLAPVHAKWKVIQASPETFQRKGNMEKITSDFEAATEKAQKSAFDRSSDGAAASGDLGPLVQKWATEVVSEKGQAKTTAATQKKQASDLDWEIKRLKTKYGSYSRLLDNALLDEGTAKNYKKSQATIDSQLKDLNGQYQTLLNGGTLPTAASEVKMPVSEQGKFYNRILADRAAIEANPITPKRTWYNPAGWARPAGIPSENIIQPSEQAGQVMSDFAKRLAPQIDPASGQVIEGPPAAAVAPAMPAPNAGKFFISGENGKPDLTNFAGGRAEADAAWAARSGRGVGFTPPATPDTAPVEPTAATVMADQAESVYKTAEDVRAAFKAKGLSKEEAQKILQGQFGME